MTGDAELAGEEVVFAIGCSDDAGDLNLLAV
jgi:hypothetical protein